MDFFTAFRNDNKLFRLTIFMVIVVVCAMVAIISLAFSSVSRTNQVNQLENDRGYCDTAITDLMNSSDYLTQQVRQYTLTGERRYMDNYWDEVNKTRTRDKALEKLLHSDITEQEKTHMLRAKAYSDELSISETWCMRMMADSQGIPVKKMPRQVAAYTLSADDKALSSAEKEDKAMAYLFSTSYTKSKQHIQDMTQSFRNDLTARLSNATAEALDANKTTAKVTWVLIAFLMILIALLIIVYTRRANRINKILEQSLKKAEAASEAKTSFTSRMSHEIRTPLNAVLGYLTLADASETREEMAENVRKSRRAANNLINIVNDVLDYSAIESGRMKLAEIEFSLTGLINDVEIVYSALAREMGIDFSIEQGEIACDMVIGDRMRINQILTNLMSNALKFTESGGQVRLRISQEVINDKAAVSFRVSDTGIGIKEEFLPHVFEAYEQQDAQISQKYGGTGLGMSIVKNLTELMGGNVDVESTAGEGTVFTVRLELTPVEGAASAVETTAGDEERSSIRGMKLLLVEDNEMNREIAGTILEGAGAEVFTSENGKEAVDRFTTADPGTFDAILMDIMMPVMNGYDAAESIRQSAHPDAERIPIIAMTANAFSADVQKALEYGMDAHVSKPVDNELLIATLYRFRNGRTQS